MRSTEHAVHTLDRVDEPASARIARIVAAPSLASPSARGRHDRPRRLVLALFAVALMVGNTFYTARRGDPRDPRETVPGASFTVGDLRLPRAVLAVLTGIAFGMAGVCFQTMLRNPLASPDIIGISNGAGAAAVFGIIVLSGQRSCRVAARPGRRRRHGPGDLSALDQGRLAGTRLILDRDRGRGDAAEHHLVHAVGGRRTGTSRPRCSG